MNIEDKLYYNSQAANETMNDYLLDPASFSELDLLEFSRATTQRGVAFWAQGQQIENSYSVAKKVIESIN